MFSLSHPEVVLSLSKVHTNLCVVPKKKLFFPFFRPLLLPSMYSEKVTKNFVVYLLNVGRRSHRLWWGWVFVFWRRQRECVENMPVTHHYCNVLLSWKGVRNINFHDIRTPPLNVVKLGHRYRLYWSTLLVKGINFYRRLRRLLMTSFLGILFFRKSLLISSLG